MQIEFDPQITTIVGDNESGKTTIVRALRWITHNRPSGIGFHTIGKIKTRVRINIDDHFVIRTKSKTRNTYQLDGKLFKAFGQSVPDQIGSFLKIEDLNFQLQNDPMFWIFNSPGQVAKELNKIIDLSQIDSSLAFVSSGLRNAKVKTGIIRERISTSKLKKEELKWTVDASKDLREIQDTKNLTLEAAQHASALASIIDQHDIHNSKLKAVGSKLREAKSILSTASKMERISKQIEELETILRSIKLLRIEAEIKQQQAEELEDNLHSKMEGTICPICQRKM